MGSGLHLGAKMFRKLSERNFVNLSGSAQFSRRGLRHGLECSLGSHMVRFTVGYLGGGLGDVHHGGQEHREVPDHSHLAVWYPLHMEH